ncbi:hypothetical protein RhiirA5_437770 [Rhizophagus irregularis]|nr:hypothetical protein RhiirA5_437770 [Rhizophagus irregularis]
MKIQNCPLIDYLTITFSSSKEHFIGFEKLLKICKNLKSLLLVIVNKYEIESYKKIIENGKEIIKKNLEFLGKWRGYPLSVLTSDSLYEREDY